MAGLLISVDVEASGPCPGHGDMISFACIVIEPTFSWQFASLNMRPECSFYDEGAYKAIGMTREEHLNAPYSIEESMLRLEQWLQELKEATGADRFVMVSDNPGFDFQWINFECWNKLSYNPFGHSARRIGDVWSGLHARYYETQGWKRYRKAPHDHNPVNDALGNAEAWLTMWEKHGGKEAKKEIDKLQRKFQLICDRHVESSGEAVDVSNCTSDNYSMGYNWSRF